VEVRGRRVVVSTSSPRYDSTPDEDERPGLPDSGRPAPGLPAPDPQDHPCHRMVASAYVEAAAVPEHRGASGRRESRRGTTDASDDGGDRSEARYFPARGSARTFARLAPTGARYSDTPRARHGRFGSPRALSVCARQHAAAVAFATTGRHWPLTGPPSLNFFVWPTTGPHVIERRWLTLWCSLASDRSTLTLWCSLASDRSTFHCVCGLQPSTLTLLVSVAPMRGARPSLH